MNNQVECDHCLLKVNRNAAIIETDSDGNELVFCCHGCQGVYHVLKDGGFSSFYDKRTDWEPGPPEAIHVTEDLFAPNIKEIDEELEVVFLLTGIRCASCIWLVENYLKNKPGISFVRVNYATHKAKIRWNPAEATLNDIIDQLTGIGYSPLPESESSASNLAAKERKSYFYRFSIGMFFSMQVMMFTVALYAGYFQGINQNLRDTFQWLAFVMATPVMFYSGYPFIINSLRAFRNRVLNMDTLVFLGSFSAYTYSIVAIFTGHETYFDTSTMIITLILLGRFIETGAKVRAGNTVARLLSLQPGQVRHIPNFDLNTDLEQSDEVQIIPIASLKENDLFEILPGSAIPADGIVIHGSSDVDEAMLTGESAAVHKEADTVVFSGTMNLNGKLWVKATAIGNNTKLSKIAEAVEEAQNRKAPIQNVADKVVGYFVPIIISIAAATFAFWMKMDAPFTTAFMNAVSVLVIACPCALGLATPLAILMATGRTASEGAVVKSGDSLEILSKTDTVCFDKTGTITKGELTISDIQTFDITEKELMQLASTLESASNHLIAKAIVNASTDRLLSVDKIKEHPGKGVEGVISNQRILAGNRSFIEANRISITPDQDTIYNTLLSKGNTIVLIAVNNELKGFIGLTDRIRENAADVLTQLQQKRFHPMILTGDHQASAEKLITQLKLPELQYQAEITPFDKSAVLQSLKADGKHTVMVGDGINDAPALTEADIGIAMGRGTDIAIESSDIVLLRENLDLIPSLLQTSKKTLTIIKQNLFWAFSYNIVAIPLAASGKIHPIASAIFMSVSSLFVVFNSLRIGKKR